MFNHSKKVLLAALFALTGATASTGVASASSTTPSTSLGYDISFPQCSHNLPASVGFGVVGVNNGHPFSANPCLARELQWASTTLTGSPEFYTNTANPGPSDTSNWPTSQQTPQICLGANSVPCSFDYGWNAAQGSFQNAVSAETQIGASSPGAAATAAPWWLDVESGNAWQTIRIPNAPTPAAFANDDAVIQGELAYFNSIGVASVGIYSTTSQWKGLMGVTGTTFATTKVWLPGYATLASAQSGCAATSFTGGRVAMIQYPSIGLDGDYRCGLVSTPATSTVSVASSATFTDQLAVSGETGPVTYAQTTGSPYLSVSSTGLISTGAPLAAGTYTVTGTDETTGGDSGTFAFTLVVGTVTQGAPTSALISVPASATFSDQLSVIGASGTVTYLQSTGAPSMIVSPTGLITTSGALAAGSYVVRGTTTDSSGDKGTFFFNLVITATSVPPSTSTPPPSVALLVARRVVGHAVVGRTVVLRVLGAGFFGRPLIFSRAGTVALVTKDSGRMLTLRVTVRSRSRSGVFTFTIALANGRACTVRYVQR